MVVITLISFTCFGEIRADINILKVPLTESHVLSVPLTGRTLSRSEVVRGRAHGATRGEHVAVEGGRPGATRQGVGLSVDARETSRRLRGPAAPPTGARRRGIQHGEDKARDGRTGGGIPYLVMYRWGGRSYLLV